MHSKLVCKDQTPNFWLKNTITLNSYADPVKMRLLCFTYSFVTHYTLSDWLPDWVILCQNIVKLIIPKKVRIKQEVEQNVEHILFDKAELAKELENSQLKLGEVETKCQELEKECKANPDDIVLQKRLEVYHNFREKMKLKVQEEQDKFKKEWG